MVAVTRFTREPFLTVTSRNGKIPFVLINFLPSTPSTVYELTAIMPQEIVGDIMLIIEEWETKAT